MNYVYIHDHLKSSLLEISWVSTILLALQIKHGIPKVKLGGDWPILTRPAKWLLMAFFVVDFSVLHHES